VLRQRQRSVDWKEIGYSVLRFGIMEINLGDYIVPHALYNAASLYIASH
jgi:hypothetical protein